MASLADHQSSHTTKLLLIGNSGAGKTSALTSLVRAGYKLRILDYDNGLDPLVQLIKRECKDNLSNVDFITLRDKIKATPAGPMIDGKAGAFIDGLKALDAWPGLEGKPATWGEDTIVVVDSLTFMSDAAWDWAEPLVPRGSRSGEKDNRAVYGQAQKAIENVLALLTGDHFKTNVIVTSHIRYQTMDDGTTRGWPTAVGQALGPVIPRFFNSLALCERVGDKRTIRFAQSTLIDLKNPAAFKMTGPTLPVETGLADFFKAVRS